MTTVQLVGVSFCFCAPLKLSPGNLSVFTYACSKVLRLRASEMVGSGKMIDCCDRACVGGAVMEKKWDDANRGYFHPRLLVSTGDGRLSMTWIYWQTTISL